MEPATESDAPPGQDGPEREGKRGREEGEDDGPEPRRSRFSDGPAAEPAEDPPRRRTGFSSSLSDGATAPPAPPAPPSGDQANAIERARALAASLSAKFGQGPAPPTGFSSAPAGGGYGLSLLGSSGGAGGMGVGGGQRGPPPGEPPPPPGKEMGTARRWNMEKGFGFIEQDRPGAEDIFVHVQSVVDGNALRDGSRVCFRRDFDQAKGKERAEDVTGGYIDPSRPPPRLAAGGGGMGGMAGGMGVSMGGGGPPPGEPPPPPGKTMGTAKRWNMEKGFGFIVPDGPGAEDVFVHAMSLVDANALRDGSRVCFRMSFDQTKGKARAEDVTGGYVDPQRPPPRPSGGGMGGGATGGGGFGGGGFGGGAPQRGPPPGEPPPPPGKEMGTAKRWNMEKGFGFIIPDRPGADDVFVHAMSLVDTNAIREGARLCFRMDFDHAKGKARAEDVTGGYIDPSRPPPGARSNGGGGGMGGGGMCGGYGGGGAYGVAGGGYGGGGGGYGLGGGYSGGVEYGGAAAGGSYYGYGDGSGYGAPAPAPAYGATPGYDAVASGYSMGGYSGYALAGGSWDGNGAAGNGGAASQPPLMQAPPSMDGAPPPPPDANGGYTGGCAGYGSGYPPPPPPS